MKRTMLSVAAIAVMASPVFAAHNNPWAGSDDVVLGKKHDAKQEKSMSTPGEDEMRGEMRQSVDPTVGHGPQGSSARGQTGSGSHGDGGGNGHGGGSGGGQGKGGGRS